jgi:hypothetical protein
MAAGFCVQDQYSLVGIYYSSSDSDTDSGFYDRNTGYQSGINKSYKIIANRIR